MKSGMKSVGLFLATGMVAGLAACGPNTTETTIEEAPTSEEATSDEGGEGAEEVAPDEGGEGGEGAEEATSDDGGEGGEGGEG